MLSNENANKNLNIIFDFKEDISVILKDSKGNPSRNRLKINIDLSLLDENQKLISSKNFEESCEYNVNDNKFNLRQYEKNLTQNLVEEITKQILLYLANVR